MAVYEYLLVSPMHNVSNISRCVALLRLPSNCPVIMIYWLIQHPRDLGPRCENTIFALTVIQT